MVRWKREKGGGQAYALSFSVRRHDKETLELVYRRQWENKLKIPARDADAYQNRIILEIIAHATNCHQLISTLLEFKLLSHVYITITARAGTKNSMGAYLHKSSNKKK